MNVKEVKPYQVSANNKKRKFAAKTTEGFVYQTLRPGSKKPKKQFLYNDDNDNNSFQTRPHVQQVAELPTFKTHPRDQNYFRQNEDLYLREASTDPLQQQTQNAPSSSGSQMFSSFRSIHLEDDIVPTQSTHYEGNDFTTPSESRATNGAVNDFDTSPSFHSEERYRQCTSRNNHLRNENEICDRNDFTPQTTNKAKYNEFDTSSSFQSKHRCTLPSSSSQFANHSNFIPQALLNTRYHPADYYSEVLACNQRLASSMSRRSNSSLSRTQFTQATTSTNWCESRCNEENVDEQHMSDESLEWVEQGALSEGRQNTEFPPLNIFPNTAQQSTNHGISTQRRYYCYDSNEEPFRNRHTNISSRCQTQAAYGINKDINFHEGLPDNRRNDVRSNELDFETHQEAIEQTRDRASNTNYYTLSQQNNPSRYKLHCSKLTLSSDENNNVMHDFLTPSHTTTKSRNSHTREFGESLTPDTTVVNRHSLYDMQSNTGSRESLYRQEHNTCLNLNFYTKRTDDSHQTQKRSYHPTENEHFQSSTLNYDRINNRHSSSDNILDDNNHYSEVYDELENELDQLAENIFESPSTDANNNGTVYKDAYSEVSRSTDANNNGINNKNAYRDTLWQSTDSTNNEKVYKKVPNIQYRDGIARRSTYNTSPENFRQFETYDQMSIEPTNKKQRTDGMQSNPMYSSSEHSSDIYPIRKKQSESLVRPGLQETSNTERNERYLRLLSPENITSHSMSENETGNLASSHYNREERNEVRDLFSPPGGSGITTNEFDSPQLADEVTVNHNQELISTNQNAKHSANFMYFNKPTFESPLIRRKPGKTSSTMASSQFDFDFGLEPDQSLSTPKNHTPFGGPTPFSFLTPTPTKDFVTYMSSSTSSKLSATPTGDLSRNKALYKGKTSSKSRSVTSSSTDPQLRSSSTSDLRTPRGSKPHIRTPGSSSSTTTEQSNVIMAITEGRGQARGEVGIAAIDTKHPNLVLCQISDSPTYIHTLTKIHVLNPVQIIMPNTITENAEYNKLFNLIKDKFEHIELTSVLRRYFSDSQGLDYIKKTCLPEYNNVILLVLHKFYALSATCALVKYVEYVQNIIFLSRSLKVQYQTSENVTFIDFETSQKLELVLSQSNKLKSKCNLYGMLNHCQTQGGQRKLRSTILQPSCNSRVIKQRLDCVTELIDNPRILCEIQTSLKKFSDIERLLSLCYEPTILNKDTKKHFEQQINLTLLLKSALESLPSLVQALTDCYQPQFKSFKQIFSDSRFKSILSLIEDTIRTDAAPAKGYALSQMQRCFAIKQNINSLLDVARTVYSEIVDDIYNKAREMSQEYDIPLRVSNSSTRAFHLSFVTRKNFKISELPNVFINVTLNKSRTCVTMTTEEIIFMNQRIKAALDEVHSMTNLIIRDLLKKAHQHMSCIYKLCENIAELDLIVSLAQVSSSNNFVQPSFGSKMNVQESRHPLLDFISPTEPVANDIVCTRWKNFHIITGPNMSGKSIYIKQVALLQIMAQVGCYVPAKKAEFRLTDHIYTRIGFNDSIECNASTFAMEMKEMAHILQFVSPTSLILVDELCRGTSIDEGSSLAWAICETLTQTKAFIFFTTHFLILSQLENIYSNVTNYHLEAKYKDEELKTGVVYTHKLLLGVTSIEHYGLKLAEKTGLPRSIIEEAQVLATQLLREKETNMDRDWTVRTNRTNEELVHKLLDHYEDGTLSIETARNILAPFQELLTTNEIEEVEENPNQENSNLNNFFDEDSLSIHATQSKDDVQEEYNHDSEATQNNTDEQGHDENSIPFEDHIGEGDSHDKNRHGTLESSVIERYKNSEVQDNVDEGKRDAAHDNQDDESHRNIGDSKNERRKDEIRQEYKSNEETRKDTDEEHRLRTVRDMSNHTNENIQISTPKNSNNDDEYHNIRFEIGSDESIDMNTNRFHRNEKLNDVDVENESVTREDKTNVNRNEENDQIDNNDKVNILTVFQSKTQVSNERGTYENQGTLEQNHETIIEVTDLKSSTHELISHQTNEDDSNNFKDNRDGNSKEEKQPGENEDKVVTKVQKMVNGEEFSTKKQIRDPSFLVQSSFSNNNRNRIETIRPENGDFNRNETCANSTHNDSKRNEVQADKLRSCMDEFSNTSDGFSDTERNRSYTSCPDTNNNGVGSFINTSYTESNANHEHSENSVNNINSNPSYASTRERDALQNNSYPYPNLPINGIGRSPDSHINNDGYEQSESNNKGTSSYTATSDTDRIGNYEHSLNTSNRTGSCTERNNSHVQSENSESSIKITLSQTDTERISNHTYSNSNINKISHCSGSAESNNTNSTTDECHTSKEMNKMLENSNQPYTQSIDKNSQMKFESRKHKPQQQSTNETSLERNSEVLGNSNETISNEDITLNGSTRSVENSDSGASNLEKSRDSKVKEKFVVKHTVVYRK